MQAVRLFNPHQAKQLTFNNFDAILGAANVNVRIEIAAYKLALREVEHVRASLPWISG
jgi:hypothetical protein